MICQPCRDAADYLKSRKAALGAVSVATMMHRGCEGATRCDCQHRVAAQAEGKSVQA